jgi:shikimate dehydrogenase
VVVQDDGSLWGDNTDAYGFLASIREAAPQWRPGQGPAVVIGGGGAARAVAFALIDAGAKTLRLVNRTREKAQQLAAALGQAGTATIETHDWADRAAILEGAALVVNTTSLGMERQPPLDLSLQALPSSAIVADIVYVPLETPLLASARARGNITVDGLGMLLHQAVPGFEAWFGVRPQVSQELRAFVAQTIG